MGGTSPGTGTSGMLAPFCPMVAPGRQHNIRWSTQSCVVDHLPSWRYSPGVNPIRLKLAWLRALGVHGLLTLVRHRITGHRSAWLAAHQDLLRGHGLELGG